MVPQSGPYSFDLMQEGDLSLFLSRNSDRHALSEAGYPLMIIETLRTPEEHAANLAAGRSWTQHSKHLDGLAIDVAPYATYQLHGGNKLDWHTNDPVWQVLGEIGEKLGLRWGGRWQQKDMGHFELE